jgi:bifunctional DNA-binding transcriptional regulator/antitoxin component of YhaV-PrlF toxin-antitoxin module
MDVERVILDKHGRILIPSALRKQMGWEDGQHLTLVAGPHGLQLLSQKQALDQIREELRKRIPPGRSVVDELIRDRREEVRRDEEEFQQSKRRRESRRKMA